MVENHYAAYLITQARLNGFLGAQDIPDGSDSSVPSMGDLSIFEQIHDLEVTAQIQRCRIAFFENVEMKPR